MTDINEHDLYEYFELYEEYQDAEESRLMDELDRRLSQYKDGFHKDAEAVLKLLEEGKNDFIDRYEAPYQDLVFDLEMHAKSMEDIKQTHTYDTERDIWVPRGGQEKDNT